MVVFIISLILHILNKLSNKHITANSKPAALKFKFKKTDLRKVANLLKLNISSEINLLFFAIVTLYI